MMTEDIEKKFEDWFTGNYGEFSFRCEHFYRDIEVEDLKQRRELAKIWLMSAFKMGYDEGVDDMLEIVKNDLITQTRKND